VTFEAVNDPPRPLYDNSQPYIYTLPEDSIRTLDFTNLVTDVDRNDEVNISFIPSDKVYVDYNPETMAAAVVGAEDWFGEEVITFVAKDLDGAITNLPVAFTIENQEDDPRVIKPIGERVILEDTFDTIPLFEHFEDPDGDDLIFTLSSNLNVEYSVDMETGIMTLTPDADWFGFREIWVTAKDATERVAQAKFFFIVNPDNDDPEINSVSPIEATHSMLEDRSQAFVVLNVTDPEFSVLIYQWYMDGKLVGPSNFFNYRPGYDAQGPHELKVVVIDEEGATASFTWTVNVQDVPRPPEGGRRRQAAVHRVHLRQEAQRGQARGPPRGLLRRIHRQLLRQHYGEPGGVPGLRGAADAWRAGGHLRRGSRLAPTPDEVGGPTGPQKGRVAPYRRYQKAICTAK
jgi:hypothetical protein